ncbi:ABC transporter ATP-binding protein/permease [bacterium]|nr:ABC transporter ATP-binding protein/permease [bacterium]
MLKNIIKLGQFIRPFRWEIVFIFISGFVLGIVAAFPTILIGLLTNALEQKDLSQKLPKSMLLFVQNQLGVEEVQSFILNHELQLKVAAIGFPIVFLILGSVRFINQYRARYLAEKVSNELRYELLNRLMLLNYRFFSNLQSGSGSLLSRTLNDTMIIQQGLNLYMDLVREPFIAVISLAAMFWLNTKLTLICLIFSPLVGFVIQRVSQRLRRLSGESQDNLDLLTKIFKESVEGIRVIQSYNLENYVRTRFRQKVSHYNAVRKKVSKRMEIASPINEFLVSFVVGGLCLYVGRLILKGQSDLSSFLMFISLAANLEKPIKKIQQAIVGIQQTEVSIQRVFQIIDSQETVIEKTIEQQKEFPINWKTIEFRDVGFQYNGDQKVLHKINLTVQRGQTIAFVGGSGGGKSTLVNLLERFFDPTEGSILIDGVDIRDLSLKRLRDEIAYVSQDTFIFDETIEENIRCGDQQKSEETLIEAATKANAIKFINENPLGFAARAGERGNNFSGGQKQRLSIARALFKNAPILILDEATSALDSASETEVQKGILSLVKNRTSFIVAHRLSTIQNADQIFVVEAGKIVEHGTHDELIKANSHYTRYYNLQLLSNY